LSYDRREEASKKIARRVPPAGPQKKREGA
jgi:hypothetical protein